MVWAVVAATVVSAGVGLYEGSQANKIANKAYGLADDIAGKQDYYNDQLMQLMANPGAFLSNPLFKSTEDVGIQAVNRGEAASGFLGSGNQATALMQYGQSFASQQLMGQEQLLAGLSGAGAASSPTEAIGAASGTQQVANTEIGNLLASLGYTAAGVKGGTSGTSSGANPTNMPGYSDWYSSLAPHQ